MVKFVRIYRAHNRFAYHGLRVQTTIGNLGLHRLIESTTLIANEGPPPPCKGQSRSSHNSRIRRRTGLRAAQRPMARLVETATVRQPIAFPNKSSSRCKAARSAWRRRRRSSSSCTAGVWIAFMISARTVQSRGTALRRRGGQGVMCWIRAEARPLLQESAGEREPLSEADELHSAAHDPHPAARSSARPTSPGTGEGR